MSEHTPFREALIRAGTAAIAAGFPDLDIPDPAELRRQRDELLEALKGLYIAARNGAIDGPEDVEMEHAEAAIAKAEGRTI